MKRFGEFFLMIVVGVLIVVFVQSGSFNILNQIKDYSQSLGQKEGLQEGISTIKEAIKKEISNPAPLIGKNDSSGSELTHDGVVEWTNTNRKNVSSLPPLRDNSKLDAVADLRLKDMFARQYFEHISPQGIGATNLAKDAGYDYLTLGENIALGNFKNDQVLVQAWMDSPGHRANILNTKFTEIGVAVGSGFFEGKKTWIGVQVFGKPNSCSYADESLKTKIDTSTSILTTGKIKITTMSADLETMKSDTSVDREAYNAKVEEYNALAHQLNALGTTIKQLVDKYNQEVAVFNTCIKS